MSRLLMTLVAMLVPGRSYACDPMPFDPIAHGRDATFAFIGYVVGERRREFEPRVPEGEGPPSLRSDGSRLVQVGVVDILKGKPRDVVEALAPCTSFLYERVTVVQGLDGFVWVFTDESAESELRAALAAEH
jgi:hypothetical protein